MYGTNGLGKLTLSTSDIRIIWGYYKQGKSYRDTREAFKDYLSSKSTPRGDRDNRLAQIREVIYQISAFGEVKSKYARTDITVGTIASSGSRLGHKGVEYGHEDEYGQFGGLPKHWIYPESNETIRDYLDRK